MACFADFGLSLTAISETQFLNTNQLDVFTFGLPPVCIDIMTLVKGLEFNEVYSRIEQRTFEQIGIKLIHLSDLIKAKKASGRFKDLDDIENLS